MSARPSRIDSAAVWSRRRLLGVAAVGLTAAAGVPLLAGCSGADGAATALATPPPDTVGSILNRHRAIRAAYDETAAAHPNLDAVLGPLGDELDEHIAALEKAYARSSGSTPDGANATAAVPAVPPDEATARSALRVAVQAAIPDLQALVGVTDAGRAPLVGSVAASCACHAEVLS